MNLILTPEEKRMVLKYRKEREKRLNLSQNTYSHTGNQSTDISEMSFKYYNDQFIELNTVVKNNSCTHSSGFFNYRIHPKDARSLIEYLQQFLNEGMC